MTAKVLETVLLLEPGDLSISRWAARCVGPSLPWSLIT